MGTKLGDALHLASVDGGQLPHETALEWGARVLEKELQLTNADGKVIDVTGDFFPAYDDDGGLLAIFTPRSAAS